MVNTRFEIKDDFYLNNEKVKIISGGIHYFRIVPQYWRDRLEKLKNMGCNTVETYVPWNLHEAHKGDFNFEGILDIKEFIMIAEELGLYVIVRPSPYICAEWEFGGLPAWLLAEDGMQVRTNHEPFLNHVRDYYNELFKILTPLQINYGGPIIMMQVENEYGYYGDDSAYLAALRDMMIECGTVVPLVTSDGPWGDALACGLIEGVHPTANFGSKSEEQFKVLSNYTKGGPLMCMEFWVGWFDAWGEEKHMTSDLEQNVKDLHDTLELGHINIYMFIGGTNFGFMNGSNYYEELKPDVTSYDYDAVLTESGEITEKYRRFKEVISKFTTIDEVSLSTVIKTTKYADIAVSAKVGLMESLEDISTKTVLPYTVSMEKLGQSYGYTLYSSPLVKEKKLEKLRIWDGNDRAKVYLNNDLVTTLYDKQLQEEVVLNIEFDKEVGENKLHILMENMGRVNFGPNLLKQRKGIDRGVQINGHLHNNWEHHTLPLDNLEQLDFTKGYTEGMPVFYKFELEIEEANDTYLNMSDWGKGVVIVNGFNLGRFFYVGPQKHLYLPGPLLHVGKNEIIVFETEGTGKDVLEFSDAPNLG